MSCMRIRTATASRGLVSNPAPLRLKSGVLAQVGRCDSSPDHCVSLSTRFHRRDGYSRCRTPSIQLKGYSTLTMAQSYSTKLAGAGSDLHQSPASTWVGHEGAAAFDLRSDTMTTPTMTMLSAITSTTLLDDVNQEDTTTNDLEAHIAALAGKEAGLFVLSGTMGNQIALRSLLTQPPHGVLSDYRSHIINHEAGGVSSLCGAMVQPVVPKNGLYLTLEDVERHVVLSDNVHMCPTRVISLENTLSGIITPLDEIRRIASFARQHNIYMHCDGARLWEAVAATGDETGGSSLADYAAEFDTVSLCFSKGLGAPAGSIVVGRHETIKHGRWTRKAIGGGLRQAGVLTSAARVAVDVTFGSGPRGEGGLLKGSHETARRVERLWAERGGRLEMPVQTNMLWLDLGSMLTSGERLEALGREAGLRLSGNRIITHYQVGEEAIRRLTGVFDQVARERDEMVKDGKAAPGGGKGSGPYAK